MSESKPIRSGIPSADRPWMQYYPPQLIENLEVPEQTVGEYLKAHCPGEDVVAIHYYGNEKIPENFMKRCRRYNESHKK